jgi:hypothetical protein
MTAARATAAAALTVTLGLTAACWVIAIWLTTGTWMAVIACW